MRWSFLCIVASTACTKPTPAPVADHASKDGSPEDPIAVLERAEIGRRVGQIPEAEFVTHDVVRRRRTCRALARIADPKADEALVRSLSDEDEEASAWAAYGLGWTCRGREDAHVRALAARAASFGTRTPSSAGRDLVDPHTAFPRAVGRCGGALAQEVLVGWVRAGGPLAEAAAYGLGDIAAKRNAIDDDTASALLDAATRAKDPPSNVDLAFAFLYPFTRIERVGARFIDRVGLIARSQLAQAHPLRAFAIRALAKTGKDGVEKLVRVVLSKDFTSQERAEAARGLGQLGDDGHIGAAEALAQLTPDKDPFAIAGLGGSSYAVLSTLLSSVGDDAPVKAERALYALANLRAPGEAPPALARRLAELRCSAALRLARSAFDNDVLKKCDDASSQAYERARLSSVLRQKLVGERRAAWVSLSKSAHDRVREAALDAIGAHPELGDAARNALAEALSTLKAGLVTTAAEAIQAHPDRVRVLSESEKRAALDPNAPAPRVNPVTEIDARILTALAAAVEHGWTEDLVETRAALLDGAVAVHLPNARTIAERACHDPNVTLREHAAKALRVLGDSSEECSMPELRSGDAGAESTALGRVDPLGHATRIALETDAAALSILFEPELAPVATARFVALARSGFYDNTVIHRVVPGFIVQFGDPEGDGYGGSGQLLPCETAPLPFRRLDVGVALAGRDTGSSQLFVTLGPYPHLDGEYSRVGVAKGDWDSVAQDDVIRRVKVEER